MGKTAKRVQATQDAVLAIEHTLCMLNDLYTHIPPACQARLCKDMQCLLNMKLRLTSQLPPSVVNDITTYTYLEKVSINR